MKKYTFNQLEEMEEKTLAKVYFVGIVLFTISLILGFIYVYITQNLIILNIGATMMAVSLFGLVFGPLITSTVYSVYDLIQDKKDKKHGA